MKAAIVCSNIYKSFKIKTFASSKVLNVLSNINFSVMENEIFSVVGVNGAGKSTLLSIIVGILKYEKGSIDFKIKNYKEKIGYMPEITNFPPNLTAYNILNSMKYIFSDITEKKINNLLEKTGLKNFSKSPLKTFSKGMLQRFNLVQSIIHEPEILILDEPFSGLDPLGRELFLEIFEELKKKGLTIMFSSHVLTDVEKLSNRVMILHKGKVSKILTKEDLADNSLSKIFIETVNSEN